MEAYMRQLLVKTLYIIVLTAASFCAPDINASAQTIKELPQPQGLAFNPIGLEDISFIIDPASASSKISIQNSSNKLIEYFLAALTLPEDELWVNLSPAESNRIAPDATAQTALGQELLSTDLLLKQLASRLTDPKTELGKKYWAEANFQKENNNYNKVWIVPGDIVIREDDTAAVIESAPLIIQTQQDYLMASPSGTPNPSLEAFKKNILPEIEKEVNTGAGFAPLRQAYRTAILAVWLKKRLQETILTQTYINQKKINGAQGADAAWREKIYALYLKHIKTGAYDYTLREKAIRTPWKIVTRRYFSGGLDLKKIAAPRTRPLRPDQRKSFNTSPQIRFSLTPSTPPAPKGSPAALLDDISYGRLNGREILDLLCHEEGLSIRQILPLRKKNMQETWSLSTVKKEIYILGRLGILEKIPGRPGRWRFSQPIRNLRTTSSSTRFSYIRRFLLELTEMRFPIGQRGDTRPLHRATISKEDTVVVRMMIENIYAETSRFKKAASYIKQRIAAHGITDDDAASTARYIVSLLKLYLSSPGENFEAIAKTRELFLNESYARLESENISSPAALEIIDHVLSDIKYSREQFIRDRQTKNINQSYRFEYTTAFLTNQLFLLLNENAPVIYDEKTISKIARDITRYCVTNSLDKDSSLMLEHIRAINRLLTPLQLSMPVIDDPKIIHSIKLCQTISQTAEILQMRPEEADAYMITLQRGHSSLMPSRVPDGIDHDNRLVLATGPQMVDKSHYTSNTISPLEFVETSETLYPEKEPKYNISAGDMNEDDHPPLRLALRDVYARMARLIGLPDGSILTEAQADRAIEKSGLASHGMINDIRNKAKAGLAADGIDIPKDIQIFFIPVSDNNRIQLFWSQEHSSAAHFSRQYRRMHISLGFVLAHPEQAAEIIKHELIHITQNRHAPLADTFDHAWTAAKNNDRQFGGIDLTAAAQKIRNKNCQALNIFFSLSWPQGEITGMHADVTEIKIPPRIK